MNHNECIICSKAGSLQVVKEADKVTSSHSNGEVNIVRGFFISTKPNQARWQVTKECALDLAAQARSGKYDFMVSPELINTPLEKGGGGHYFGTDTYDDLIKGYANHSHGKIVSVSEPYSFNDGTDDFYLMSNIKLRDSQAASALMEHGAKTWNPFAVSPHIYPLEYDNSGRVSKAKLVGMALVIKGAYGDDAVITHACTGEESYCMKSVAASVCCQKEDSRAAQLINGIVSDSSLLSNKDSLSIMNQEQVLQKPKEKVESQDEEIEKPQKGMTNISIKELEQLREAAEQAKAKEETVNKLVSKDKNNTLGSIFKSVEDSEKREELVKKYFEHDTDKLHGFVSDYEKFVVEPRIEALKKESSKNEKENSKSASILRKEPKAEKPEEESKAAGIVPKAVNEVYTFDSYMRGYV